MRIIIAGDGDTGTHLANTLSIENQDIVLIGSDASHLAELDSAYNFITYKGNPLSAADLKACGIEEAGLFVSVTPDENINLLSAQIAKGCGARMTAARIDNDAFLASPTVPVIRRNGVDCVIYPEMSAAKEIVHFIRHNWVSEWFELHHGELIVAGVRIEKDSMLAGRQLRDTNANPRIFHVSSMKRGDEMIIPRGDTEIHAGDTLFFSVLPENLDKLCRICGHTLTPVRRIMITGGGDVTANLLAALPADLAITVVEADRKRCGTLAMLRKGVTVVNSSANDVATLKEEGIGHCDMFIALTGSSETNIVSCMVAREHGVPKTVARIEQLQYIPEAESLSIDKIINKKKLNVGKILNMLVDSGEEEARCLLLDHAEIIELVAREDSDITSRPIFRLSLPKDITIGGLIRHGKAMLVEGSTQIEAGDHVLVFCRIGSLSKVERLFR